MLSPPTRQSLFTTQPSLAQRHNQYLLLVAPFDSRPSSQTHPGSLPARGTRSGESNKVTNGGRREWRKRCRTRMFECNKWISMVSKESWPSGTFLLKTSERSSCLFLKWNEWRRKKRHRRSSKCWASRGKTNVQQHLSTATTLENERQWVQQTTTTQKGDWIKKRNKLYKWFTAVI